MTRELRGNLVTLVGLDVNGAAVGVLVDATGRLVVDGGGGSMVSTHKARAYAATNQAILTDTWTTVMLDTETYDPGANFDVANYRYVARVSGYYHFNASGGFASLIVVADKRVGIGVAVNGTIGSVSYQHSASTTALVVPVGDTVHLNIGDLVTLSLQHTFGVTSNLASGTNTVFLSIFCISED